MRKRWPHVAFWLCFVLVLVNVALVCFAPVLEIRVNAFGYAVLCGLAALAYWTRAEP